ncbi:MAG: glycosyltransferase family 4 protein [Candidatus Omnitrophica bacterium]|nr:glycosyltransferase family 4 protein [Candidatus Omnitrophota bacterium]
MKILQIVHAFPPDNIAGVEVYTYNLCRQLTKNHKVYVFHRVNRSEQKEYEVRYYEEQGIHVYTINNTFEYCYSFKDLYINNRIADEFEKILGKVNPDIVHIQHLIFLSVGLIHKIKKRKIPILFTLHDYWLICPQWHYLKNGLVLCSGNDGVDCMDCIASQLHIHKTSKKIYHILKKIFPNKLIGKLQNIYISLSKNLSNSAYIIDCIKERKNYMKQIYRDVDLFISPSEFLRDKFVDFGLPKERLVLARHGFDINIKLFNNHSRERPGRITFGFIGTIVPAKGLHILITAFNEIRNNEIHLKIYGKLFPYRGFEYYPNYLKKLSRYNKNVHFMGAFDNHRIGEILSEIDFLVVPSVWYENCPLTIQEAFLTKTPVIASRIGGIPELVADGVNGLLFNPGETNHLREKLEYVMDDLSIIDRFKKNMPEVKSIEENVREIEKIYDRLVGERKLCQSTY